MRLQHLHLLRPVPYSLAGRIQEAVVRRHIDFGLAAQQQQQQQQQQHSKLDRSNSRSGSSPSQLFTPDRPSPFLLTFQTTPTYSCGRREIGLLGPERKKYLEAGGRATFVEALRGGQTTWHGPGQLTAYLICSLRAHSLTPRCYVRFLEDSIVSLCKSFGVPTRTTSDPGVWLAQSYTDPATGEGPTLRATDSKLCAVGVHMRRGVTSHGIGLNVHPDLAWFQRIVACGLVGKRVTSLEEVGVTGIGVREVAVLLANLIARNLKGVDGIDGVDLAGSAERPPDYSPPPSGEESQSTSPQAFLR